MGEFYGGCTAADGCWEQPFLAAILQKGNGLRLSRGVAPRRRGPISSKRGLGGTRWAIWLRWKWLLDSMKEIHIGCQRGFQVRDQGLMPRRALAKLPDQLRHVLLVDVFAADSECELSEGGKAEGIVIREERSPDGFRVCVRTRVYVRPGSGFGQRTHGF